MFLRSGNLNKTAIVCLVPNILCALFFFFVKIESASLHACLSLWPCLSNHGHATLLPVKLSPPGFAVLPNLSRADLACPL